MLGRRLNEHRNGFTLPEGFGWPNLLSTGKDELSGVVGEPQSYEFGIFPTTYFAMTMLTAGKSKTHHSTGILLYHGSGLKRSSSFGSKASLLETMSNSPSSMVLTGL